MTLGRVRPGEERDVPAIADLVARHTATGDLLPRSAENIRASLADWRVGEGDDGRVMACGSLWAYSASLAEVRSLVVEPEARHEGWGGRVLGALVEEGRRRGFATLFTLTRAVDFFLRHGFTVTDKSVFPEKIFKDCQACPLIDDCDETALWMDLGQGEAGETERRRWVAAVAAEKAFRRGAVLASGREGRP